MKLVTYSNDKISKFVPSMGHSLKLDQIRLPIKE